MADQFPPFLWSGPDACVRYANDFAAVAKRARLVALGATVRSTTTIPAGSRLYAVTRVTLTPTVAGRDPSPEDGIWTFVLLRAPRGWKIASMSWGTLAH